MTATKDTKPQIVVLRETWQASLISDAGSFAMAITLTGVGRWMGSDALQWIGALIYFLCMISIAMRPRTRKTPQQAADWLRDTFGVTATKRED